MRLTVPELINLLADSSANDPTALQLKVHIASGSKNEWAVMAYSSSPSPAGYRFDNFEDANTKFDSLPDESDGTLVLYTQTGTSVVFRRKGVR